MLCAVSTVQLNVGKGHQGQTMHKFTFAFANLNGKATAQSGVLAMLHYNGCSACGVCALESSSYI